MPTEVQNIVLPPIQKFIPPPEKPPEAPASSRGDEFGAALKAARNKSAEQEKTDAAKARAKDPKAEAKKDADGKGADKASTRHAGKTKQTTQTNKSGKSKSSKPGNANDVNDADANPDAEEADSAAAAESAQSATSDQTEAATSAPQSKAPTQPKDDPEHASQDEKKTSANDSSAGAQVVQPIDRGKDQNQHRKEADDHNAQDEDDPSISGVNAQGVNTTAIDKNALNSPDQTANSDRTNTEPAVPSDTSSQSKSPHAATVSPIALNGDTEVAVKPSRAANDKAPPPADASTPPEAATPFAQLPEVPDPQAGDSKIAKVSLDLDPIARAVLESQGGTSQQTANVTAPKAADAPPPPPEVQFAQSNHDRIVTGVQSQLLPHGGSMEIRLDPPELGALRVMVEMRDGVMSATFQTSNEEATQLLSHSLNQLKHVLESQGVSVERLQVQQAPKGEHSSAKDDSQQQQRGTADDHAARQEQQRKEMMRRMWRRVSGAGDPIDYLA
jgi:flagellar hook-length control protein FliK